MASSNYQGGNDVVITQFFQPMLQTYQRNLAYQQQQKAEQIKQRDKVALEAQKDLSKLNANGLRQADLPAFNEAYSNVKNTFYKLNTTTDPNEQRRLSMELNNQLGQIEGLVYNSKEVAKWENNAINSLPSLVGKGKVDQARAHITGATSKPSSELSREYFDVSQFYNPYDISKVESAIGKLATQALSNADNIEVGSSRVGGYQTSGGKKMDTILSSTSVKQPVIFEGLSNLAQRDPNVKAYVDDLMASDPTLDFNGAVALLGQQYGDRFTKSSTRDISAEKPKGITVNVNTGVTTPEASVISDYALGRDSRGNLQTLDKYVQFNQSQEIGGLLQGFDPLTRKNVEVQGTANKARVLGIGSDKSGREYALIAYKPDPEFEEEATMLVNRERYLNNANMPKTRKAYVEEASKQASKVRESVKPKTETAAPKKPKFN